MHCDSCGRENPAGSRFCLHCGAALAHGGSSASTTVILTAGGDEVTTDSALPDPATDAHAAALESLPVGSALLVVQRGPNAGSRFLLDQEVTTVGRHTDSDILLDDITVSRQHVEFHREADGFSVHDAGSLNGTYVNRKPVDVAMLAAGDEVQIGKFRFVYLTGPRSRQPATG
jgi:pSer/pThr/pTyr-binding forkhead associated (FHA) protein